jgi:divalent metal cation (Fe/Co/Zn/Cd) transporter
MHDLVVHDTGAGLQVDVHLEWPPDTSLSEAHRRSAGIERSLRDSFPRVRLIHTHLECVRERSRTDPDVTGAHPRIVERVCQAARGEPGVRGCGDVRILEGESGLWVTLTCVLAAGITLREAHEIATEVEKSVMMAAGGLHSVSVHAEPDVDGP